MPLYEYRCTVCGHRFEKIQSFSAPDEKECPVCQGAVERLISAPAIQFKGSGFYSTDYPSKSSSAPKSSDSSAKDSSSSSGESSKDSSSSGDSGTKSSSTSDSSSSLPSASASSSSSSSGSGKE